jgi:hypothetical protein
MELPSEIGDLLCVLSYGAVCADTPLHMTTRKAIRLQLTTGTTPQFCAQVTNTVILNI